MSVLDVPLTTTETLALGPNTYTSGVGSVIQLEPPRVGRKWYIERAYVTLGGLVADSAFNVFVGGAYTPDSLALELQLAVAGDSLPITPIVMPFETVQTNTPVPNFDTFNFTGGGSQSTDFVNPLEVFSSTAITLTFDWQFLPTINSSGKPRGAGHGVEVIAGQLSVTIKGRNMDERGY